MILFIGLRCRFIGFSFIVIRIHLRVDILDCFPYWLLLANLVVGWELFWFVWIDGLDVSWVVVCWWCVINFEWGLRLRCIIFIWIGVIYTWWWLHIGIISKCCWWLLWILFWRILINWTIVSETNALIWGYIVWISCVYVATNIVVIVWLDCWVCWYVRKAVSKWNWIAVSFIWLDMREIVIILMRLLVI